MTRGYLEEIEAQLVERVERGAGGQPDWAPGPRGPRRRREWLAVVPALAAAAVIIAIVVLSGVASGPSRPVAAGSRRGSGRPPATHADRGGRSRAHKPGAHTSARANPTAPLVAQSPPGGPVPAGFGPVSFTAISELRWWLLGSAPCASPPCTSIVRTDDGGSTFVGTPAPRTTRVSELRFADAVDGYAFNPDLWVTRDGGAGWHRVSLGGTVVDLEAASGYVYAIVRDRAGVGRLLRAPVGSDSWTTLSAAGDAFTGLWVYGRDVLLESTNSSASRQELSISYDRGASFAHHPAPPSVALGFQGIPPVVWAEGATGMMSGVWRSLDAGADFRFVGAEGGAQTNGLPSQPNSAAFAAASPTTAVYGYRALYRTADGGSSWHRALGPSGITWWQYLGFTDATHGVAIGYVGSASPANERLYYTTDGGQSYHRVTIASG
jgi:photosystem II stability/assembly factor-like uncharacterized protein